MISIIMPYYNKKEYVENSINSVLEQTFENFELIIIYDDELKKDLDFIETLVKKDRRIKLIINDKNFGAGESRNRAIKFSKGDFLAFIDSDDVWEKDKLETQLDFMLKKKIKFSHTSYKIIDKNNNQIKIKKPKEILNYKDLLKSCDIGLSTVLMSKDLIDDNTCFANLKTKEDYVLWLKIARKGIEINAIEKPLASWRKVENSLSSSVLQKLSDGFLVYFRFMKFNLIKSLFCLIRLSMYSILR